MRYSMSWPRAWLNQSRFSTLTLGVRQLLDRLAGGDERRLVGVPHDVSVVADRPREDARHRLVVAEEGREALEHLLVAEPIPVMVLAAGVGAGIGPGHRLIPAPVDDHRRPAAVEVEVVGVVEHVDGEATRRAHVDLQRHEGPAWEPEELEVERPLPKPEGADDGVAGLLDVGRNPAADAVVDVGPKVDRL